MLLKQAQNRHHTCATSNRQTMRELLHIRKGRAIRTHHLHPKGSIGSIIVIFQHLKQFSCPRFVLEDLNVKIKSIGTGTRSNREWVPMGFDRIHLEKCILSRLEGEQRRTTNLENNHASTVARIDHSRGHNRHTVSVLDIHRSTITNVVQNRASEPTKVLAAVSVSPAFHNIQRVCDGQNVHHKHQMMNNVEDFIWDLVTKVGSNTHSNQGDQDTISSKHDLLCKFITEGLISITAQQSKEGKEKTSRQKHDCDHGVSKMDMDTKHAIQGNKLAECR
mmetsp:Transcript_10420/g.24162  ORF Transcript_10420/g.24162 Transcript_10420/m.24162 type:complete len:277 (+) Transcript_10420:2886-3716(+)